MRRGGAGSGGSSAVVRESGPVGNREQVVGESECRVNWQLIFKNLIDERKICSKMKFTVKTGWANACAKVVDNESEWTHTIAMCAECRPFLPACY